MTFLKKIQLTFLTIHLDCYFVFSALVAYHIISNVCHDHISQSVSFAFIHQRTCFIDNLVSTIQKICITSFLTHFKTPFIDYCLLGFSWAYLICKTTQNRNINILYCLISYLIVLCSKINKNIKKR